MIIAWYVHSDKSHYIIKCSLVIDKLQISRIKNENIKVHLPGGEGGRGGGGTTLTSDWSHMLQYNLELKHIRF